MNVTLQKTVPVAGSPVLVLLNPRQFAGPMLWALALGGVVASLGAWRFDLPKWAMTAIVIGFWLPVMAAKWKAELPKLGLVLTLVSVLLTTQSLHTLEHVAQWVQYHLFFWTLRESNGFLSPLNAEWVHFVWNVYVLAAVFALVIGGMRNPFAWLLLGVAFFHTIEHTYMFVRYQMVLLELQQLGVGTGVTAQGLPGILGRDGWLARSTFTQGTFLCSLPGLTTATRLDVHFWWNVLEMVTLAAAAHVHLQRSSIKVHDSFQPNDQNLQSAPKH